MAAKKAVEKQYYKVINPKGHHGFMYKLGLNVDPNPRPLKEVGSCSQGALYFTDKENLPGFRGYGTMIGWITPKSPAKLDQQGDKWKAHSIEVTKMLPIKDALPLIYTNIDELVSAFESFNLDIPREILNKIPLEKRWTIYAQNNQDDSERRKFLQEYVGNKRFVNIVYKLYKKRADWRLSDEIVALWLYENGVSLEKLRHGDLQYLLSKSSGFRTLLRENVGEKTYKLIKMFADY